MLDERAAAKPELPARLEAQAQRVEWNKLIQVWPKSVVVASAAQEANS